MHSSQSVQRMHHLQGHWLWKERIEPLGNTSIHMIFRSRLSSKWRILAMGEYTHKSFKKDGYSYGDVKSLCYLCYNWAVFIQRSVSRWIWTVLIYARGSGHPVMIPPLLTWSRRTRGMLLMVRDWMQPKKDSVERPPMSTPLGSVQGRIENNKMTYFDYEYIFWSTIYFLKHNLNVIMILPCEANTQ